MEMNLVEMWEPAGEGNSIETQTRFNISLRAGGKLSPRGAAAPNGRHLHCPHTMIVVCLHLQGLGFLGFLRHREKLWKDHLEKPCTDLPVPRWLQL